MLEWVYWAADRVDELAKSDPDFRDFAEQQERLAPAFEALAAGLTDTDRELLLDYMEAAENMQYRKTQLAYEFGKQVGRRQTAK